MRKFHFGLDLGHCEWKLTVLEENSDTGELVSFNQSVKNEGIVKGEIIDEDAFTRQLENIFLNLSDSLGNYPIKEIGLALSLPQFNIHTSKGYTFPQGNIDDETIDNAVRMARTSIAISNQTVLLESPRKFYLDGEQQIRDPRGMNARRLDVDVVFVATYRTLIERFQNVFRNMRIAIVGAQGTPVPSIIAASSIGLSKKEKETGVLFVDFGAISTVIAVYQDGVLQQLKQFPFGSHTLTEDLALSLKITPEEAEDLKINSFGEEEPKKQKKAAKKAASRSVVQRFIEKKFDEYVDEYGMDAFAKAVRKDMKIMGGVLSGGGSLLPQSTDWFKGALGLPCKAAKDDLKIFENSGDGAKFFASAGVAYTAYKQTSHAGFWKKFKGLFKNFSN